jgi:hypothetical protein
VKDRDKTPRITGVILIIDRSEAIVTTPIPLEFDNMAAHHAWWDIRDYDDIMARVRAGLPSSGPEV